MQSVAKIILSCNFAPCFIKVNLINRTMRLLKSIVQILFVLLLKLTVGQESCYFSDYRFNMISTQEGLLQSSVLSMVQDHKGFIWMGTKYGISKYDGYKIVSYKNNPADTNSLPANEIIELLVDYKGDILIGTRGAGLFKYHYNESYFEQVKGIPANVDVTDLYQVESDVLYVGTSVGLFEGILSSSEKYYAFENKSLNTVYYSSSGELMSPNKRMVSVVSILKTANNKFLIGTEDGMFTFDIKKKLFAEIDLFDTPNDKITSILKNGKNQVFVGSSEGLVIIDTVSEVQVNKTYFGAFQDNSRRLGVNWINKIILDKDENVWGGTRGGGLFKLAADGNLSNFTSNSSIGYIRDNHINSLLIDRNGVLWIGTESRGCNTLDLYRKKFNHIELLHGTTETNFNRQVTAIAGDNSNKIYLGTAFNGISVIEPLHGAKNKYRFVERVDELSKLPTSEIIALLADTDETLWVGMAMNYLVRIDKNKKPKKISTDGFVFAIHEDRNKNIWFGTWGSGFGKVNKYTNEIVLFSSADQAMRKLSNDIVLCINDDSNNNLWIGTKGGGLNISPIDLLKENQSNFINYSYNSNNQNSLSNNEINCIYIDSKENVWIGTGNGLNKVVFPDTGSKLESILQGKLKFERYAERDGLPNGVIYGILEDGMDNLWISTLGGLSKFNANENKFENFNVGNGLQANEFHANAYYKSLNNQLYFGGVNGITMFNPQEIKHNPFKANVVITALKVSNVEVDSKKEINGSVLLTKNIAFTDSLVLESKHKEFAFEFSGMHYANSSNVKYAYRLVGFNNDWRLTENNIRLASYTNISEGEYVFQVKATNGDGLWGNEITELKVTILPPLWRHPMVFAVYFIGIVFLLYLFRKYSIIAVNEKTKLKIEALKKRKAQEITEAKTRFFTNISHEIRTPLTLIYSPIEKIVKNKNLDTDTFNSLNLVRKNIQRLLSLTNQLLQLRKIDLGILNPGYEKVSVILFINDILEYFENQALRKSIAIKFESVNLKNDDVVWIDKEMMTTVFYNLLSNAFKYSKLKGEVKVIAKLIERKQAEFPKGYKVQRNVGNYLSVEISDKGVGIPTYDLDKIFLRFYQSSNKNTSDLAGSGIGLSIVKDYVELHKGVVEAFSQVNQGTTIRVLLPMGDDHINETLKQRVEASENNIISNSLNLKAYYDDPVLEEIVDENDKNVHLLIVDDDIDMLNYLSNHFKQLYKVSVATNGKEAWCLAQKNQPNLIISDIMMPEIDGIELCELVKTNLETSHIPIILLTAKVGDDNVIKGYENGADRYISKPFSVNVLEAQVEQLLATRQHLINLYSKKVLLKPRDITITSADEKFMTRLLDIIEENLSDSEFDVAQMVDKMNMSHSALLKKVKVLTDTSLVDFVRRHRLNKAALIFSKDKIPVNEVAYMVGFSDPKYFSKCFSKQFGKTPTEFLNDPELEEELV